MNNKDGLVKTTIVYDAHKIWFTEFDADGRIVNQDFFRVGEKTQVIRENSRVTLMEITGGFRGKAVVHPNDVMTARIGRGRRIAFLRARIEMDKAELRELCHGDS